MPLPSGEGLKEDFQTRFLWWVSDLCKGQSRAFLEEDWHEQRKGNASAMVTVIREGSTREANLILEVVGEDKYSCVTWTESSN